MGGTLSLQPVDLSGKVAIVTGGNAGIGYETAKAIALMGARVIIACRTEEKAIDAIERMRHEAAETDPGKAVNVEFMKLDLSSFKSTKDFTVAFKEKSIPLHILINNAGIFHVPFTITEDGNELHNQVNYLSHFLLTLELLPIMLDTAVHAGDCRVVILASIGHYSGQFDPSNMNGELSYSRMGFYQHSKLYTVMFGFALQRRLCDVGITVSAAHPGFVRTENADNVIANSGKLSWKIGFPLIKHFIRSPVQGAMTSVNCAVNPELNSQQFFYYDSCVPKQPSDLAMNTELQENLWEISIQNVRDWLSPQVLERYGATIGSMKSQHDTLNN